jgi:hypothetical protein
MYDTVRQHETALMAAQMKRKLILILLPVSLLFSLKLASPLENQPRVDALKKYLLEGW